MPLDTEPRYTPNLSKKLIEIYDRLLGHFGPQNWWPSESSFEIMVEAILTQSTAWTNVEKAIRNLKSMDRLSPSAIRTTPRSELADIIRPIGYFNVKAKRLKALAWFVYDEYGDEIDAIRGEEGDALRLKLLGVDGVGEETADAIILYVAQQPTFVVDAYARRLIERLGSANINESYESLRDIFIQRLMGDTERLAEYHALIVKHGKEVCTKTVPSCSNCVLRDMCEFGKLA